MNFSYLHIPLTIYALSVPQTALSAQWDGQPTIKEVEYNRTIVEGVYLEKAIIKAGELTTNYGQTEVQLIYNTGGCNSSSRLYIEWEIEATTSYGNVFREELKEYPIENEREEVAVFQFNDLELDIERLGVSATVGCEAL